MNYRELLYRNALNAIDDLYEKSKWNPDVDLFRIHDIINSVNENQFASKEWLVNNLMPFIDKKVNNIAVLGSWYGLISLLLREQLETNPHIHNVDSDPETARFAKLLFQGMESDRTYCIIEDAEEWVFDNIQKCDIIINTSCEHMEPEDLLLMTRMKAPNTLVCFQGNNYHEIQSHINTHNSLDEFVDSLGLRKVEWKGSLDAGKYERYMVIGK
jgi:spermidine synthase